MNTALGILAEFWAVLAEMAPYLLFGFFVAGLLSLVLSARTVERHLGGRGLGPIVKASFWGVPMPLCSCSVIPVATSLRRHGASRGATAAFLLSTPQTGVDSLLVTYSLLGPVFAVFRPIAAFVSGLLGGYLVEAFGGNPTEPPAAEHCACAGCAPAGGLQRLAQGLRHGFVTLPRDIGKELLVGLALAGLIAALLPETFFADVLKPGPLQVLAMMALGIPLYVCATASVPIAAALIAKGVSPGAAFAFLVTGPATNAATLLTLRKLLGGRAAALYLGTIVATALGGWLLLDGLFTVGGLPALHADHAMLPAAVRQAAAIILLAVLLAPRLMPRRPAEPSREDSDEDEAQNHPRGKPGPAGAD
ncbi:MAG: permease [Kiritimatiellae bacterium]|nr:permease [Kiritimatiellia bacterium]